MIVNVAGDNLVYDTKAWQFVQVLLLFFTAINNNAVYFGDANGDFFAN